MTLFPTLTTPHKEKRYKYFLNIFAYAKIQKCHKMAQIILNEKINMFDLIPGFYFDRKMPREFRIILEKVGYMFA